MIYVKNMARVAITVSAIPLTLGCGDGSDAKWIDAPMAMSALESQVQMDALMHKSTKADTSCVGLLKKANEQVDDPTTIGFKLMAKACGNGGMAFAREARCKERSLQIKCQ